jgi:chromosome segregation ATPase
MGSGGAFEGSRLAIEGSGERGGTLPPDGEAERETLIRRYLAEIGRLKRLLPAHEIEERLQAATQALEQARAECARLARSAAYGRALGEHLKAENKRLHAEIGKLRRELTGLKRARGGVRRAGR